MRLIIAGSRTCTGPENYQRLLNAVLAGGRPDEIISGGAKGPDRMGEEIAQAYGIPVKQFIPDWDGKGKGAGFLRNGDMAVYASEVEGGRLVALWDGQSRGTAQMIDVARNYGLDVVVVEPVPHIIPQAVVAQSEPFIFKQSHSSLNVFETCPRQYYAKYVSREVKFVQSAAAKWGDDVHNALEAFIQTQGTQRLPANMAHYERFGFMMLERAARFGGQCTAERKAAVNKDYKSTFYSNRAGWLGGKIDLTILYPHVRKAEVFDWKTGKVKNDVTQLKLYGGFTFADFPEVDQVNSGYVWLEEKERPITPPLVLTRSDVANVWGIFQHKWNQLRDAYMRNAWPEKPNGLCEKWCDVVACAYHGKGRR
jgi:hypothetical protein